MGTILTIQFPADFEKRYKKYKANLVGVSKSIPEEIIINPTGRLKVLPIIDKYKISVKDNKIWVNEYLIGKPHAVGSNFEFFEYIRSKSPHTLIKRSEMPNVGDGVDFGYTKDTIKGKSFIKILTELGFKGEILKAFFYKRGKSTLIYRGDQITKEDLEKAGVKISLFLKELELAHIRNSPE